MAAIASVRIQRFKRVEDAPFDLERLNLIVGANNAGKSSVIQGLHFGIGLLQTIGLTDKWAKGANVSTSINPNQLIYSPSDDVYALAHGGKLMEDENQAMRFEFNLTSGQSCAVAVRKGRNRNILVAVENVPVAQGLSLLDRPFTIFSPGLAGIAKNETFISDGVLLRALARGDANLVLRNILLRLWDTPEWGAFISDLQTIFPGSEIEVSFDETIDEYVAVTVHSGDRVVPLELAGTGMLQATQILSYMHRFSPQLVVLDEPDSHLHPNNQSTSEQSEADLRVAPQGRGGTGCPGNTYNSLTARC